MKRTFENPYDVLGQEGLKVGPSEWMEVTQEKINLFAEATGDFQWIHVDIERAKAGPFGAPIAHGYWTLSLAAKLMPEILVIKNISMGINYGTDKARFIHPVKVGAFIRGHGEFIKIEEIKDGVQSVLRVTIEIKDVDKPALVVDTISRYYP